MPSEQWQPNKSTILSVLISIQAMVLGVTEPYTNEPGYATRVGTAESLRYTNAVQCKTVKHAMVFWAKRIKDEASMSLPSDVWNEIVAMYWKHNSLNVLETVRAWSEENSELTNYTSNSHRRVSKKSKGKVKGKAKEPDGENLLEVSSRNSIHFLARLDL